MDNLIYHISKVKKKYHVIISIDAEKTIKIQHPFLIKILSEVGILGNFLKLIKGTYEKSIASIIFNGKHWWLGFVPKIRNKINISALMTSIHHCTWSFLARGVRHDNEIKGILTGKWDVKLSLFMHMTTYAENLMEPTKKL